MRTYRKAKSAVALALAIILLCGVLPAPVSAASSAEIQKQIDALKSEKAKIQKEIDELKI